MQGEFVFKSATLIEWQKWLNQWRHQYVITIHYVLVENGIATMLIERAEKS